MRGPIRTTRFLVEEWSVAAPRPAASPGPPALPRRGRKDMATSYHYRSPGGCAKLPHGAGGGPAREPGLMIQSRHGGRILVDQLAIQGCDTVFCVPGESYLAALDALFEHPSIRTVVSRQEGAAAMMAEAHGKLTGRPGVCFVTRAPGTANACAGLHVAHQDSTPMILFIGQVGRAALDREAFQEVDYRRFLAPLTKWVAQIDATDRIPEYLSHAWHVATAGRPGPVALALPEDMLSAEAEAEDTLPAVKVAPNAGAEDMRRIAALLRESHRPLVVVGGPGWDAVAAEQVAEFAERLCLPVAASLRCQDYIDNRRPCYVGDLGLGVNPALADRTRECDLLICVGARLGALTTQGYRLVDIPNPRQRLVHVHPSSEEPGRVYRPELAVNASSASFAARLSEIGDVDPSPWQAWSKDARADYERWTEPVETPGAVKLESVICHLREVLPAAAIVTNGAGNYSAFVQRYYRYRSYPSQLAPTSGSMGYGLPAAIAAKLACPARPVVCFAGDGCFQMTGQELASAVQYGLAIVVIVANNSMYGTIRMHQEQHYPGRIIGTDLHNPDFAALARSYGAHAETVTRTQDFPGAFERAANAGRTALIELRTDPDAISPSRTLRDLRRRSVAE